MRVADLVQQRRLAGEQLTELQQLALELIKWLLGVIVLTLVIAAAASYLFFPRRLR